MILNGVTAQAAPAGAGIRGEDPLREAARKLEAAFLAEFLKASGMGPIGGAAGGGIGEEQFASFLRQIQAEAMAEAGGIGLAEALYRSLAERAPA